MEKFKIVIFVCNLFTFCVPQERRILNGDVVKGDKPYMVYLLKAPETHAHYIGWMCGGSIIHPLHILTSASCVRDVYNVYVISGTRDYVPEKKIDDHACAKKTKKKIVSMCEFKKHDYNVTQFYTYNTSSNTGFEANTQWAVGNLAVARVDTPFNFHGDDYEFCHYPPQIVSVNFLKKYEEEGIDAVALGWGNTRFYRPDDDINVYNEPVLRYTSTQIMNKEKCLALYDLSNAHEFRKFSNIICTFDKGNLDSEGVPFDMEDFCYDCEDTTTVKQYRRWKYREVTIKPPSLNWLEKFGHGICQNDQGGPLVTWIGGRETVIGVASSFLVTTKMECKGPFIFTSTACSSKLIFCVMSSKVRRTARDCAAVARESGQKIVETVVNWDKEDLKRKPEKENYQQNKPSPDYYYSNEKIGSLDGTQNDYNNSNSNSEENNNGDYEYGAYYYDDDGKERPGLNKYVDIDKQNASIENNETNITSQIYSDGSELPSANKEQEQYNENIQ